jgi:ABC-type sugar transport system permease subunit
LTGLEGTKRQPFSTGSELPWFRRIFSGRRGRHLREYLTGYLMISPAVVLIFTFGIFPVGFALYVSLHKWRLKKGDFIGLDNYVSAVDNLTYVATFALAIGALISVWLLIKRLRDQAEENGDHPWGFLFPGAIYAALVVSFLRWTIVLLPEVLDIANKIIGLERTAELFLQFLGEAFVAESVLPSFYLMLGLAVVSIATIILTSKLASNPRKYSYQAQSFLIWMAAALGVFLFWYTFREVIDAYRLAAETGGDPGIWPQVVSIGSGVILLIAAWRIWRSAESQNSNRAFWSRLFVAVILMTGGYLLISEILALIPAGDEDMWNGLRTTIFYSLGTVPFQLAISLFLAVLLFQKLAGSELFRMLYFLPYVTPFVASAAVFRQMFSVRPQAPVNQALGLFGAEPLRWLQEPKGIFEMLGISAPTWLPEWVAGWVTGPSLALVVIMIYSIWVYVGYDTVIYLAGLGNISSELIEAAEIDGAGRWQVFRNIIFPLLSPTTYFLSLIAIIGTFKAFAHIWVMRHEFSVGTVDTFSVTIFLEFFNKVRYGYASALAFVLFAIILSLTYINNRIQGTRVFYG